ncbi:TPA: hypothetical protein R4S87_004169 [Kluyvera cryocrescens]|nr:hypothetical protein [Kluyvera cryocrescens]
MKRLVFLFFLPFFLTGCAAIAGSEEEAVYINSTPTNSAFVIADSAGNIVVQGRTPQSVILKKADGSYFGQQTYTLTVAREGYYSTIKPLEYRLSHWYTLGNLPLLGIPGWLIVDPYFGGMYTFKTPRINVVLRPCQPGPFRYMCT